MPHLLKPPVHLEMQTGLASKVPQKAIHLHCRRLQQVFQIKIAPQESPYNTFRL